ncbi:MAG: hypothetical protein ACXWDI_02190 [Nocardioides sp.]
MGLSKVGGYEGLREKVTSSGGSEQLSSWSGTPVVISDEVQSEDEDVREAVTQSAGRQS